MCCSAVLIVEGDHALGTGQVSLVGTDQSQTIDPLGDDGVAAEPERSFDRRHAAEHAVEFPRTVTQGQQQQFASRFLADRVAPGGTNRGRDQCSRAVIGIGNRCGQRRQRRTVFGRPEIEQIGALDLSAVERADASSGQANAIDVAFGNFGDERRARRRDRRESRVNVSARIPRISLGSMALRSGAASSPRIRLQYWYSSRDVGCFISRKSDFRRPQIQPTTIGVPRRDGRTRA